MLFVAICAVLGNGRLDPHARMDFFRTLAYSATDGNAPSFDFQARATLASNGQHIVDVLNLKITDPLAFESSVNQWPGVVTMGVFAHQKAHVCLLGTGSGVKTLRY